MAPLLAVNLLQLRGSSLRACEQNACTFHCVAFGCRDRAAEPLPSHVLILSERTGCLIRSSLRNRWRLQCIKFPATVGALAMSILESSSGPRAGIQRTSRPIGLLSDFSFFCHLDFGSAGGLWPSVCHPRLQDGAAGEQDCLHVCGRLVVILCIIPSALYPFRGRERRSPGERRRECERQESTGVQLARSLASQESSQPVGLQQRRAAPNRNATSG